MTEINPISVNSQTVSMQTKKEEENITNTEEQKTEAKSEKQNEQKQISAADVLNFLANTAAINHINLNKVSLSPEALVNKFNSPEAIARIEAMMQEFESNVVTGLAKFEEELGAAFANLPEEDRLALSAQYYVDNA